MYTLVNKNYLIPTIEQDIDQSIAITKLYRLTNNMDDVYCNNAYIVCTNQNNNIIFLKIIIVIILTVKQKK